MSFELNTSWNHGISINDWGMQCILELKLLNMSGDIYITLHWNCIDKMISCGGRG